MNEVVLVHLVTAFDLALVAVLLLALPGAARRGLLFGVNVGSEKDSGPEAEALRRGWRNGTIALLAAAGTAWLLLGLDGRHLTACIAPLTIVLLGAAALYLRLHLSARDLAPQHPPEPAPPPEGSVEPGSLVLPLVTMLICAAGGTWGLLEAAQAWPGLPERIPTHFGASGQPDAWSAKSFASVFALPLTNVVMGVVVAGFALLTARARLSLRRRPGPEERAAQLGFRNATVNMLCGCAVACTGMLGVISHDSLEVALGRRDSLGTGVWWWTGLLLVWVLGYTGRLLWFHGQGGSRREGKASGDELTDGLADDRHWKMGVFYVNRDDPAVLVEKRFGVGYTVNFGNRWGIALVAGMFLLFAGVLVLSLVGAASG